MIRAIKNSHAFGRDEIDGTTLKLVAHILAPTIAHIINLSLGTSHFPIKWKVSWIVPLLKSRDCDKSHPSSFHLVAQLPLISKLAERTVQTQMLNYLETSNQLAKDHHAYRFKTSTTTALIQLMDTIAIGADCNKITASLSIDLSAAFDCVSHVILNKKLQYYGFDLQTLEWIASYLTDRTAYVVIGSANSSIKTTFRGIPQGSILGPLLYLLFINKLPSIVNNFYCGEEAHQDTLILFGGSCNKCSSMPVFADNCQYLITSNDRYSNQIRLEEMFIRIRYFL